MATDEPTSITLDILKKIQAGMGDLNRRIDAMDAKFERRFEGVDRKLGDLDHKVVDLDRKVVDLDRKVVDLDRKVGDIDRKVGDIDNRLGAQGKRLTGLEGRMHELVQVTTLSISRQLDLAQRLDAIERRVDALETR